MDIQQLQYFVAIVQNDNNLSKAAEKLHISQPALSQVILKFEKDEGIVLFNRHSGRLGDLTLAGEKLYINALKIIENYNEVMQELREFSSQIKGVIRIGIPPLILTVLFTQVMAQLMVNNPHIQFDVVEKGSFELRKMLLLGELDLAIMITPHGLNPLVFDEIELHSDELSAFMNRQNPLAKQPRIEWQQLQEQNLAMFDDSFMIHHHLKKKFDSLRMRPRFSLMSGSWDFLIEMTRTTDFITVLPSPIKRHFMMNDIVEVKFIDPIEWHVVIVVEKRTSYTLLQKYLIDSVVKHFKNNHHKIRPFENYLDDYQKNS